MRVAGYDIGTNSVRVLITDVEATGRARFGLRVGFSTRLGEGLSSTCRISPEPLERTCRVFGKSVRLARALGATSMVAAGTHALRAADNAEEAVRALAEAGGQPVRVLSAEQEALFAYIGAFSDEEGALVPGAARDANQHCSRLVIDVGGGSTTLTRGLGFGLTDCVTLPIGAVSLTEKFLRHDPPHEDELRILKEHVLAELKFLTVFPEPGDTVRGIGGAITSLASTSLELPFYVSRRVEGYILGAEETERCAERLARMTVEEREELAGLRRKRAEIAVAGAVLVALLMKRLELSHLVVSTRGLRYGLALEAARTGGPFP